MPKLQWDRTLETCLQRNRNALLIAGQPPYWRSDQGLGAGDVPSLDHEDIISMLEEITPGPTSIAPRRGGMVSRMERCRAGNELE